MANPVPTLDQAFAAVLAELTDTTVTATVLPFEDRHRDELELLREYQQHSAPYETEILLIESDVESIEGKAHGERYSIYRFELRHLFTMQDEEQISRIAKHRAEIIRRLIDGNTDIFRIGSQVPLRTPEIASLRGRFVTREDSKYYESFITFEVEARRWE